ncbi:MAG TPA: hypothetical protein VGQ38_14330 [Gaiellaceae bacterium]|nr:hypothetical protein [Gaiellaceae bacterium]
MSFDGVRGSRHDYAVVWRIGDGPTSCGRLEVGDAALILHGSGEPGGLRIPFDGLSTVEIGRGAAERVNGERSLVVERHSRERVLIAALGGMGLLGELNDLVARLRAEQAARACVVVVVPIRRGTAEEAGRLVEEGPPFEVETLGIERHHVFVSEREVVFFFEGESAADAVDALFRSPDVLRAAVRWRGILAGPPRLAEEHFGWTSLGLRVAHK